MHYRCSHLPRLRSREEPRLRTKAMSNIRRGLYKPAGNPPVYSTRLKSQGVAGLAGDRVERRLTAILAADVAGYSRLMGADEEETLARLKALRREIVDPRIVEHRGRIVKTTGDGLLVEFASVVD